VKLEILIGRVGRRALSVPRLPAPEELTMTGDKHDQRHHEDQFVPDLLRSDEDAHRIAAWLRPRGHTVEVLPCRVAPDPATSYKFSDEGDGFLDFVYRIGLRRVGYPFGKGGRGWPWAPDFYAEKCSTVARLTRLGKPLHRIFIANNDFTWVAYIDVEETFPKWYVQKANGRVDRRGEAMKDQWCCPMELIKFMRMT
jgi:hypothetical protein